MKSTLSFWFSLQSKGRSLLTRRLLLALVSCVAVAALMGIAVSANKANRAAKARSEQSDNAKAGTSPGATDDMQPAAPMAPVIVATLTDNVPAGTKVAPGGTINYTAVITNNGAASPADDATNLNFSAPLDANTTLVPGSIHASPIAFNDTYNWVGNTQLDTSARGLTPVGANDVAVNAPAGTDTFNITPIAGGATTLGGTVSLLATGHYTYTPPLNRPNAGDGVSVNDSFTYTITNSADPTLTSTGTVTITLTGRVFYLQAGAAGDGRSNTPSGNPATMSTNADKASDIFYIFSNASSLNGLFTVDAGQQLLGQGVALVVNIPVLGNTTLFSAQAPTPTTTNGGGNCVTLAGAPGNNTLSGFNIGNCSGTAIAGSNVGTLTVSTLSINTTGAGLDLTGVATPSVNVVLGGLTSTGGAKNVNLVGLNGTVSLAGGALSGASGNAFDVTGAGTANISYSGTITNTAAARLVNISGKTGGTVALSGALSGTGSSTGINLTTNTGTTMNFSGGVTLSTAANAAFTATGGGTVNVDAAANNNTITTTTGIGINVQTPTNIGGTGITFKSITVNNGASNSAASGIRLNGTTGNFTVTGDATLARNGSGGTINRTTDDAIDLNNASNVTLQSMNLTNNGDTATDVTTAETTTGDQTVQVNGGSNIVLSGILIDTPTGSGYVALNVGGTNRINSNSLFTNFPDGPRHGAFINNTTTSMTLFEFKNSTMNNSLNDSSMFLIENGGAVNTALDMKGSTFENLDAQAVSIFPGSGGGAGATGTLTATVGGPLAADRNFFQNAHSFVIAGVTLTAENNVGVLNTNGAVGNVTIENNLFDNIAEEGQIANTSIIRTQNAGGKLTANVKNNTIQNISYATGAGGRHVIGHIYEPSAFTAADFSNITIDDNTATNVTYPTLGNNREFIFIDYRAFASGGTISVKNNNWNMPTAGSQQGIEMRFRQTNSSNVNILVNNNGQGTGAVTNTAADFLDIDSEDGANVNATITNNKFTDSDTANGEAISVSSEDGVAGGLAGNGCYDINGNNISAAGNAIELNEAAGNMNVEQASSAALAAANGGASIVTTGTPTFGITCAVPPPRTDPSDDSVRGRKNENVNRRTPTLATAKVDGEFVSVPAPTVPVAQVSSKVGIASMPARSTPKASVAKAARLQRNEGAISHHSARSRYKEVPQQPNAPTSGENVTLNAIATFPAGGKSITIKYSATVNTPPLARQVSTLGTVTANGGISVTTTDPGPPVVNGATSTLVDTLVTWNGTVNTDWNTANNWTVPAPGAAYAPGVSNPAVNDVVIPNVGNQPNISATDIGVYSLSLANGRTLSITNPRVLTIGGSPGGDLTIDGIITGGNLNLGTGAHVINNAGGTGSIVGGNIATVLSGSTVTLNNNLQMSALAVNAGGSMNITNRTLSLARAGAALAVPGGATFTTTGSTVVLNGGVAQTIAGIAYNNLTINNSIGLNVTGVTLTGNATVNGVLTLTSSDLDTGAFTLTQPNTTASTGVSDVVGTVSRTGGPFAPATVLTFGNPNNQITFTAAGTKPSALSVTMEKAAPATYAAAVQRNYTITPTGGSGYTAALRLHYVDSELNGNVEANLNLRRGPTWPAITPATRDSGANWVEASAVTAFSQWTFSSLAPTAAGGAVAGRIVDSNGAPVEGAVVRLGGTQNRKFITDANGFYRFENVETGGFYTVTPSRANYSFTPSARSFSQIGESTEATFGATLSTSNFDNPLDTPEYFVRQHYLDFLGREPDESGFNFWSDQIIECGTDQDCIGRRRENVSAAYFLSIEFQQTGGLVDGLYRASYGVRPNFGEFMPDTRVVGQGVVVGREGWQTLLAANKTAFVNAFVNRPAFHAMYDGMDNTLFVNTLIGHTGVTFTAAERDALTSGLVGGTMTRADVVRSIAENEHFVNAKFNEAFVMMEYFGYLRRDPDANGFQFWLSKLNQFNGNFEQAEMVKAFIVSGEFRDRFPR